MIPAIKCVLTIEAVFKSAGISIVKGKALCPFHHDTTPSISFRHDRFRCWACGESGDIIDFTEKFYGINTGMAIKDLAAKAGISSSVTSTQIRTAQKEREARNARIKAFREWERYRVNGLSFILSTFRNLQLTEHLVEVFLPLIHKIDELNYEYEILCGHDDELKLALYRESLKKWN